MSTAPKKQAAKTDATPAAKPEEKAGFKPKKSVALSLSLIHI